MLSIGFKEKHLCGTRESPDPRGQSSGTYVPSAWRKVEVRSGALQGTEVSGDRGCRRHPRRHQNTLRVKRLELKGKKDSKTFLFTQRRKGFV